MKIGLYGALLGARMGIFKCLMFRIENTFSVALPNESMTICIMHMQQMVKMSTDLPLVANNQPGKS